MQCSKIRATSFNRIIATAQSEFFDIDLVNQVAEGVVNQIQQLCYELNKQQVHQRGNNERVPKTGLVLQVEVTDIFSLLIYSGSFHTDLTFLLTDLDTTEFHK